jgi:hypothetical protein
VGRPSDEPNGRAGGRDRRAGVPRRLGTGEVRHFAIIGDRSSNARAYRRGMHAARVAALLSLLAAACGARGTAPPVAPAADAPAAPARPVIPPRHLATIELAADVRLAIHAASLADGTPCWIFVTDGLAGRAHPELVLSITERADDVTDRYPADAVALLRGLASALPDSTRLDPYQSGTLGVAILGRSDLNGLVAVPAEGPPGLELPAGAVTLLPLTRDETEVARDYGGLRITSALGLYYRYYPTAWWVDRDRPSVVPAGKAHATSLAGTSPRRAAGITFLFAFEEPPEIAAGEDARGMPHAQGRIAGGTLRVRITDAARHEVVGMLRELGTAADALLLLEPDPHAGGRLVWGPDRDAPHVISGRGFTRLITGSFLALVVSPDADGASLLEDGAALMMTPAERDAVVAALDAGRDHHAPARAGRLAWTVEFVRDERPTGAGRLVEIQLVTAPDLVEQRASVADAGAFLLAVEGALVELMAGASPTARTLHVRIVFRPGRRTVDLRPTPADAGPWLAELRRRIDALPVVVVSGEVELVARFALTAP